jgi:hypothetical protein
MFLNKNKYKTFWSFSQHGNIWRFIFGGNKYIIGETRDTVNKKLFFFTLDYTTGNIFLNNFSFENDNFWVSIEGATEEMFFIGRFEKPELPYQKNIIALDIKTGEKIWENEKYTYLFNTESRLFGIVRKFESNEIAELDTKTGEVKEVLSESEHLNIFNLKNNSDDILYENSNYPLVYNRDGTEGNISEVLDKICKDSGNIEYIKNGSLLIFNYYVNFNTDKDSKESVLYENRFVVYNTLQSKILFEDILNKQTNFCVPDNFFIKNEYLFYLKEKIFLNCIKLK